MPDRNIDGEGVVSGRDYGRVFLSLAIILAVVLATALVPALPGVASESVPDPLSENENATRTGGGAGAASASGQSGQSGGSGGSPSGSQSDAQGDGSAASTPGGSRSGAGAGGGSGSGGGGVGALSVGNRTTVGGLQANGSAFQSTSQQIHFVVETNSPSYWRTGAFERYTGDGWQSTGETRPYDGGRLDRQGKRANRIVQKVTLRRSATSLPAAWRPARLAGAGERVRVTDARAFRTATATPTNATYAVISFEPPRNPELLRSAGTDYPSSIERRYTQLPDSTEKLAAFTDDLTASADSPYERAVRVEQWLERNKRYSLNASRPDGDVATGFVFGMEKGYCEYFATAMTAMLRTQDVPARYVVGYSTGQPRGDSYVVRGMNAHAWVEVYFPDVGWVRFDPTPGRERLANETQAFVSGGSASAGGGAGESGSSGGSSGSDSGGTGGQSGTGGSGAESGSGGSASGTGSGDSAAGSGAGSQGGRAAGYAHTERGSPGETFAAGTPGASTSGSGGSGSVGQSASGESGAGESGDSGGSSGRTGESAESGQSSDPGQADESDENASGATYEIQLNESSLVPGTDVTVTVTRDDEPAAGVTVLFDGDPVGETNADGNVTGTVPYESTLNVSVRTKSTAALDPPPADVGRLFDVRTPPLERLRRAVDVGDDPNADVAGTYGVETNVTLDVAGAPIPGATVTVRATIRDHPVPEATVRLGGTTVGQTNESGALRVTLPSDSRQVRVAARRGDAKGARNVSLVTALNVTVTEPTVPKGNVSVRVRANGTAVSNASVAVEDQPRGRTDAAGNAAVTLPDAAGNVTVVATRGVASGNATVRLERLTVTATPTLPVAFPWTDLRVRAELDGDPAEGVQVRLNGRRVGTTGSDGTLTATYPPATGTTVVAEGYQQTVRTDAGNPLFGPALLLGLVALALVYGRRRGVSPRGVADDAAGLVVRLCRRTVAAVVAVASRVDAAASRLLAALARLREDVRTLPEMLRTWLRAVGRQVSAFARRRLAFLDRLRRRLVAAGEWLASLRHESLRSLARAFYAWLVGLVRGRDRTGGVGDASRGGPSRRGAVAGDEEEDARLTIREAWREFLGYASVRRWRTMTPGEVATRAVERDGLPADAVTTLRDAFRDVEYGQRSPDERLDGAREALDRIRRAAENPTEASD